MSRELLTAVDVAKMLGISHPTVLAAIANNQLPTVTIGQRKYVPRLGLEAWLMGRQEVEAA
jgi:excisionase family DNA binding protein